MHPPYGKIWKMQGTPVRGHLGLVLEGKSDGESYVLKMLGTTLRRKPTFQRFRDGLEEFCTSFYHGARLVRGYYC